MDKATCETCRWFLPKGEHAPMNFCRRYPPIPVYLGISATGKTDVHFTFAVVSGQSACGEHHPRTTEPETGGGETR